MKSLRPNDVCNDLECVGAMELVTLMVLLCVIDYDQALLCYY